MCIRLAAIFLWLASPLVFADTITPVAIKATSEWGINIFAVHLIDGSGLIDLEGTDDVLDDYHDNSQNWENGWHSGDFDAGIPGGTDDDGDLFTAGFVDEQILEFDLGSTFTVATAHIWQQNQSGPGTFLAPDRGVEEFEILYSTDGNDFSSIGTFNLEPEEGIEEVPAQIIDFDPIVAQRIRFNIHTAFSENPNEFVGLGEVRFEGTPAHVLLGDFNLNQELDAADIDALTMVVLAGDNDLAFDLTSDSMVDATDREFWINELKRTFFGDSNLDGEFSSSDFVAVFEAGEYEDQAASNSTWATGDWNGDREFDSSDFVLAFGTNAFEQGPRATAVVPEPNHPMLTMIMVVVAVAFRVCRGF